ncbi:MAG: aminotransferase class V-fold PLP-dependent enzyme [Candidatus Lernaella stagnicola]|nr:aminotransferase class V-fold PLP-dependent enzyme [Candidatus Lernaella stagnicola]
MAEQSERATTSWLLDPEITYLNHGSVGACPREVLAEQRRIQEQMEREPIDFFDRQGEALLDAAREALAAFVTAAPEELAFVPNATAGVNTVLRSLSFAPSDELLVTDHAYKACENALRFVARRSGAQVVVAPLPFPVASEQEIIAAVLERVTPRTRLALIDHITSPTALLLPVTQIVRELRERGVDTLVDGAHVPGQAPLDIDAIGATYYTGNCHKWLFAPKGSAFLHVRRERQSEIHPLIISHGYAATSDERSKFWLEFDWTGTADWSPFLALPRAISFHGELMPGGSAALMAQNHALALEARDLLAAALKTDPPCPNSMVPAMTALPLPDRTDAEPTGYRTWDPLQQILRYEHRIEAPILAWPASPKRLIRVCAQIYNERAQYERLAAVLRESV